MMVIIMVLSVGGPDEISVFLFVFVFAFVFKLNVDLDCCTVQKARAIYRAELLATKHT